jgi:peptidyl-prolyl cis-trans isomerase D
MMQGIRNKTKGILVWIVFALLAIISISWALGGYFSATRTPSNNYLAKIGGELVFPQDLDKFTQQWLQNNKSHAEELVKYMGEEDLKNLILNKYINNLTLNKLANANGFAISREHIAMQLAQIENFHENGKFSQEKFTQFLNARGISEQEILKQFHDYLLSEQLNKGIISTSFFHKSEAEKFVRLNEQRRDLGYLKININDFENDIHVSKEDKIKRYEESKLNYILENQFDFDYIELKLKDLEDKIQVSEDDAKKFFNENFEKIKQPATWNVSHIMFVAPQDSEARTSGAALSKAEEALSMLKLGSDFESLASYKSEDPTSAENRGEIGAVRRADGFPLEVYELTEPGAITDVVATDFGYHIFKLNNYTDEYNPSFAESKNKIKKIIRKELAEAEFNAQLEKLSKLAAENPQDLTDIATEMGLEIKATGMFLIDEESDDDDSDKHFLVNNEQFRGILFSNETLNEGFNSGLLKIDLDHYALSKLKVLISARNLEFAEVEDKIEKEIRYEQAVEQARELAKKISAEIKATNNPNAVAKNHGLEWQQETDIVRNNMYFKRGVLDLAFGLEAPDEGAVPVAFDLIDDNFYVVSISDIKVPKNLSEKLIESDTLSRVSKIFADSRAMIEFSLFQNAALDILNVEIINDNAEAS